jgi:hypothetical protein
VNAVAILAVLAVLVGVSASADSGYEGSYCSGKGDPAFLQLIDESFDYFHPTPRFPNISMLYRADWDCLSEGPTWGMWWVQNSYGPTFCSLPFLQEPWVTSLQHAQDLWFDQQGDGKTMGQYAEVVAPDGSLCDCAGKGTVIYVQGDGNWKIHDWCYGFTSAGVLMQAELLLISRDIDAIKRYMPHLERACNFIEARRDPKTNLFPCGPAANLLAPSYGGAKQPDGTYGKAFLAEISVTYLAALERMVELHKLTADTARQAEYERRAKITRESLPQLLSDEGYFVKSIELDGTKHGVFGQDRYGYFETSVNVDAICHRAVDDTIANRIYDKIVSIPQLRPHDYLITNYPSLDDTYVNWGSGDLPGIWKFGTWVNGGAWTTQEARTIMAYYRLGRFEDVRKSALKSRSFAVDYQYDAPLKDFGNTPWFDNNLTNICYDALGVPAATIRGLFEYVYMADRLILYPHVPPSITEYRQCEPIRFGHKRITISLNNGGPTVTSVKVNGRKLPVESAGCVVLPFASLPESANVEIIASGGWPQTASRSGEDRQELSRRTPYEPKVRPVSRLPIALQTKYDKLTAAAHELQAAPNSQRQLAFVTEAIRAFDAYRERQDIQYAGSGPKWDRKKQGAVLKMYRDAAEAMYQGALASLEK